MTLPATIGREQRQVVPDANAPAPAVYVGYRVPSARDRSSEAVQMLAGMLSGRSGSLYESLVRRSGVATSVIAANLGLVDGGDILFVRAAGKPGSNADSLEAAVQREVAAAVAALSQTDLERARARTRFGLVDALQRTGGFGGRADMLAQGYTFYRDPNWVNTRLAAIDRVTLAEVQAVARERLVPTNRVTLVFVPNRAPAAQPQTPARP